MRKRNGIEMNYENNENGVGPGSIISMKKVGSDLKDSDTNIARKVLGLVKSYHMILVLVLPLVLENMCFS